MPGTSIVSVKVIKKYDYKNVFILHFNTGIDKGKWITAKAFHSLTTPLTVDLLNLTWVELGCGGGTNNLNIIKC